MGNTNFSGSTAARKRSASAMQRGPSGLDVASHLVASVPLASRVPYTHYAMIFLDNEGKVKVDESASILDQGLTFFTTEIRQSFKDILGEERSVSPSGATRRTSNVSPSQVRRRHETAVSAFIPDKNYDDDSDIDYYPGSSADSMLDLQIGETQKVMAYYKAALQQFQQFNCRTIAKAFIKFIEPRKQVKHPYNGGKALDGSAPGATGDPEKTKPEWWPSGVIHKEPDHLRKEYRIELLLHIICKVGCFGITAEQLKEVAEDTRRSLKDASRLKFIFEILRVRKMEERFERGEVEAETVVVVRNPGPHPRGGVDGDSLRDTAKVEASEPVENGLVTQNPSVDQNDASLATPIETLPVTNSRSPRGTIFMPVALKSDASHRDGHFDATPPHHTHSFSQPVPSVRQFYEYYTPLSSTSSREQQSLDFNNWDPCGVRPDSFTPVDYRTHPSSQGVPTPMYQIPMTSPAHLHEMSHHLARPQFHSMGERYLPFSTDSPGHAHGLPIAHLGK